MKKLRALLSTGIALLCTLALVAASALAPLLWLQAQDKALLSRPLPRGEAGQNPEEELYLVRALTQRNQLLRADGLPAGYQLRQATAEELRPALNTKLSAMAKAGVLPPALATQLAVLLEQEDARFTFSIDAAGFEQTLCAFASGPFASLGLECEGLTGRVVNLWLSVNPGQQWQAPSPSTALEAYSAWLGLNVLDDWAESTGSGLYTRLLTSGRAQLQLYLLSQPQLLSLGVTPTS